MASPGDSSFPQELFQMLVPKHWLGSSSCQQKYTGECMVHTVLSVVVQFDKVITTCLGDMMSTAQDRVQ